VEERREDLENRERNERELSEGGEEDVWRGKEGED